MNWASEVSFPSQLQKERGVMGKVSPIGWAYLYLSANNGKSHMKRENTRKREGRDGS
jgi:hypothetical protein